VTIVNDDSRFVNKLEASLTDNARVIIYNRHMFIVQAMGGTYLQNNIIFIVIQNSVMLIGTLMGIVLCGIMLSAIIIFSGINLSNHKLSVVSLIAVMMNGVVLRVVKCYSIL